MGLLDFLFNLPFKLARKRLLGQIKNAVNNTYKQGRLKIMDDGSVEYIGKDGTKQTMSIDDCAAMFWNTYNEDMMARIGRPEGNLTTFNVTPDDFKKLVKAIAGYTKRIEDKSEDDSVDLESNPAFGGIPKDKDGEE